VHHLSFAALNWNRLITQGVFTTKIFTFFLRPLQDGGRITFLAEKEEKFILTIQKFVGSKPDSTLGL